MALAVFVTPVMADDDVYDGPKAIKPMTVTQAHRSASPNAVCDFEHQCYPEQRESTVPAAPPVMAAKPIVPQAPATGSTPADPLVKMWRGCIDEALQSYEQSQSLPALRLAAGRCQLRLEEQGEEDLARTELPLASPYQNGRRNLGCGWWPIGSDADRDCARNGRSLW